MRQSYRRPLPPEFVRKEAGSGERYAQLTPGQRRLDDFRSYSRTHGTGGWHGAAGFATYDERFLRWCAAEAIDVDVVLDRDVHADGSVLDGYDTAVSVGHDEYTTWEQRDALDRFVASGGDVVFLSGNAHYWQVRVETDLEPDDAMACFKHRYHEDPVFASEDVSRLTSIWSDPLIGRPENQLTGVSFTRGGYARMADKVRHGSGRLPRPPARASAPGRHRVGVGRRTRRERDRRRLRVRRLRHDADRRSARPDRDRRHPGTDCGRQ